MNRRSAEESKKKVLGAALRVFSEYGYRGDCMRLIAKQAEMSVGGVYLYFKSKEDLCLTLMKERMDDLSGELDRAINMDRPEGAIATYIRVQLEYAKRHKELILTYGKDQGFGFGVDLKRKFAKKQSRIIQKILNKGIEAGVFAQCNVEEAARIIIGIIRGYVLSIVVDPENLFTIDECNKFVVAALKNNGNQQERGSEIE